MKKFICTAALLLTLSAGTGWAQMLNADNIDEIVNALTDDEKVHMLTGSGAGWGRDDVRFPGTAGWTYAVPRLGIPFIYLGDGPHGLNMDRYRDFDYFDYSCTTTPTSISMASTFDTEALEEIGALIGYEVRERGMDIILGPAINLQRTALGGRNQEYMSEDPLLSGKLAAAYIRGAQSQGIGTSLKHFVGNEAETRRKGSDTQATRRTLRELYLKAFEIAVKEAQPWTVMTSYNYVNGIHTTERHDLVTDILRGEWGFEGLVMTDWDGGLNADKSILAGTDILEPGSDAQRAALRQAIADGTLDRATVDAAIRRILELTIKSPNFKGYKASQDIRRDEHMQQVRRIGAEGAVLLQNASTGSAQVPTLPIRPQRVALYGCTSYDFIAGCMGVGGTNNGYYHVSLVQGLREAGFTIDYALLKQHTAWIAEEKARIAAESQAAHPIMSRIRRPERPEELLPLDTLPEEKEDPRMAMAKQMNFDISALMGGGAKPTTLSRQVADNDIAIITIGRTTGEGADRNYREYELRESERLLIEKVSRAYHEAGKKVIVVLNVCSGIETQSWAPMVDAVINVWQPGVAAGYCVADVLTGKVNPCGRLPQTWELHFGDQPADRNFPSDYRTDNIMEFLGHGQLADNPQKNIDLIAYEEGIYMGYRYFTTANQPVAYPFGYGLSYTTFGYSDATITPQADGFEVSVRVTNTGKAAGREVVQLYVSAPAGGLDKPLRELKAFGKTRELQPGESEILRLKVTNYDLASYNEKAVAWQAAKGNYSVQLCKDACTPVLALNYKLAKPLSWKTTNALPLQADVKTIKIKK